MLLDYMTIYLLKLRVLKGVWEGMEGSQAHFRGSSPGILRTVDFLIGGDAK